MRGIIGCQQWVPTTICTSGRSRKARHLSRAPTLGKGSQTSLAPVSYGLHVQNVRESPLNSSLTLLSYNNNWGTNIREICRCLSSHLWMDDAKVPHDLAKGHHPGLSPREESILLTGLPVIAPPCPSLQGRVTPCIYIHASMLRCELGLSV